MKVDARRLARHTLEADLCIIGSGPAGLAVAHAFIGRSARVVVLESGNGGRDSEHQALGSGETFGDSRGDLALTRCRSVGGTPHIWNTWIGTERVAKYVPLDRIDFERRPWLPMSGWPFPRESLDPFYERAHAFCGLGPPTYSLEDWAEPREHLLAMPPGGFATGIYQLGCARTLTETRVEELKESGNVLLCSNATVTGLETDYAVRRITHATAAADTGPPMRVSARLFVLAAGGIENARLLMLSNRRRAEGLGNRWDMVGRCFMEHPRDFSCRLLPTDPRGFEDLSFYDVHRAPQGAIRGRLAITEEALRRGRFVNFSVTLRSRPPRASSLSMHAPWENLLRPHTAEREANGRAGASSPNGTPPQRCFDLEIHLEQAPHFENRVVLSRSRDALGQPRAELHWRWRDADRRQHARARTFLFQEIARSGLGRIVAPPETGFEPSAHHHMGTTRMSLDPRRGVVDVNARVHDLSNLFVAGSSVFPTGGFANPTLTIVALSFRLAGHLDELLRNEPRALPEPARKGIGVSMARAFASRSAVVPQGGRIQPYAA
jgi:choline dehydrogenase-like flavoprotein